MKESKGHIVCLLFFFLFFFYLNMVGFQFKLMERAPFFTKTIMHELINSATHPERWRAASRGTWNQQRIASVTYSIFNSSNYCQWYLSSVPKRNREVCDVFFFFKKNCFLFKNYIKIVFIFIFHINILKLLKNILKKY